MLKSILILPDGRELSSGAEAMQPIMWVKLTESVNDHEELTMGAVFANILEARINTYQKTLNLTAGDEVILYKEDDCGIRHRIGIFVLEKPTCPTADTMELRGFDRVIRLNRDLTQWLKELDGWPYRLIDFAGMVCNACGLELVTDTVPNGDFLVQPFFAEVTGYQLMRWIGEVCCRFCRANADGKIEFGWYTPAGVSITPSGDFYYLRSSLSYEEYEVAPVEAVQIRLAENESGMLWPQIPKGANSYIIESNPILQARVSEELLPVLENIWQDLPKAPYRPFRVSIPATLDIHAGNTVQITDKNGVTFTSLVMSKEQSGQKDTLECTGSPRRDSATAQNNKTEQEKNAALKSYADKVAQEKADAVKKAAQADLVNFSQAVTGSINALQSQIDGNITTWFDNYVPTAENEPANSWTTDAQKKQHLGDLFYIVDNGQTGGQCYRWTVTNGTYGWLLVEDTEVAKALADAAKAKDLADGKRRVFVAQPVPPYDMGDLWAQGDSGDLMVCKVYRATGNFEASDWALATDYINSKTAGSIAQSKVDAQTQLDIFNKLTNDGACQGLFIQDNQLYINASFIKIGALVASLIQSGILQSKDGQTYFNLDSGEIVTASENGNVTKLTEGNIRLYDQDGVLRLRLEQLWDEILSSFGMYLYGDSGELVGGIDSLYNNFWIYAKDFDEGVVKGRKAAWKQINGIKTLIAYEEEEPTLQNVTTLYSGTLASGSVSFTGEYSQYIIVGYTTQNQCKVSLSIPAPACDGSLFQLYADGEWVSFNMSEDALTISRVSSGGAITGIYGIL